RPDPEADQYAANCAGGPRNCPHQITQAHWHCPIPPQTPKVAHRICGGGCHAAPFCAMPHVWENHARLFSRACRGEVSLASPPVKKSVVSKPAFDTPEPVATIRSVRASIFRSRPRDRFST